MGRLMYHFKAGSSRSSATFIPKKLVRNVSGRNVNVIQLSRHRLVLSSSDRRASRILIDLYIFTGVSQRERK